jgi:hypothetical protein
MMTIKAMQKKKKPTSSLAEKSDDIVYVDDEIIRRLQDLTYCLPRVLHLYLSHRTRDYDRQPETKSNNKNQILYNNQKRNCDMRYDKKDGRY